MHSALAEASADRFTRARAILSLAEQKVALSTSPAHTPGTLAIPQGLAVPEALSSLFPSTGLQPGSCIAVTGACSTSLVLALAGAAMGEESWCAFVGFPHLGLGALKEYGIDRERAALIPYPDTHIATILSTLIDGLDIVLIGADLTLTPALWRSVTTRARTQKTLIIRQQPAARQYAHETYDHTLESIHESWVGLTHGSGRLRFRKARALLNDGKHAAGSREVNVRLSSVGGGITALPCRRGHAAPKPHRPALTLIKGEA